MIAALMKLVQQKMGELSSDYFTVTPQVLEAVGGKVPATINGKFPKNTSTKAVVEVTPVLKWNRNGGAKRPIGCVPRAKSEGNDQTISYKMGSSHYEDIFDYVRKWPNPNCILQIQGYSRQKDCHYPCCKSS